MDSFVGQIRSFAGNYAPQGWALCNGALLPIAQYQALYSLITNRWGGDGRTTFALPDLRGRVPVGQGQGGGLTARTLAQAAGASTVTLTAANYPTHTHALAAAAGQFADTAGPSPAAGMAKTAMDASGVLVRYADASQTGAAAPVVVPMDGLSIGPAGNTGPSPHGNLMPYLAISYIICLEGVYPSRP